MAKRRRFTAPPNEFRCKGNVILSDGSGAQCMHRKEAGRDYCRQHGPESSAANKNQGRCGKVNQNTPAGAVADRGRCRAATGE